MFNLISKKNYARRGRFDSVHGSFETPAFMNVATVAAIKGGLCADDLRDVGCQVMLSNTYHLHLRPGDELIHDLGGLHTFTGWDGPILTDSGGFQVFSLSRFRKITEEGTHFASHIDGRKIFLTPEKSIQIQSNLGSTIAMAMDECIENPSPREYVEQSCMRDVRWLKRCCDEIKRLRAEPETINKDQLLFGINQGGCFDDIRVDNMKRIAELDCDGYSIGGLAVGETSAEMYHVISAVEEHMPSEKIRYLMGVGTPGNILESVSRGVDLFDCVMPARNGRHGHLFTWNGVININNAKYERDMSPIDEKCDCPVCRKYSRAYLRHLLRAREVLALRFGVIHNLYFYNRLMSRIRDELDAGTFEQFKNNYASTLDKRI